jgi:DNA (cytosine-5)-methyltransferase 1
MSPSLVLDLCAGPGGWSHASRALGLSEIGIELDPVVCATRRAAGHPTIRADIAALPVAHLAGRRLAGVIASPPCQGMSVAGLLTGWDDLDAIITLLADLAAGHDTRAQLAPEISDPRSLLIAEPLRYALAARPEWVVCEQVPAVLPLWQSTARHLHAAGYATWTGILNAADYGVPQTRRRAVLIASRVRTVHRPTPTHARAAGAVLFGPEPAPWLSMSDALGWVRPVLVNTRGHHSAGGTAFTSDQPAWTLTKSTRTWLLTGHPHRDRLTAAEGCVLQGFPPQYPFAGTRTKVFEQIGNAVPPPLAHAVLTVATGREVTV